MLQEFTKQLLYALHEKPDEYTDLMKMAAAANMQNSVRGYERASFVPKKSRLKIERARKRFQNTGSKRHHERTRSQVGQHLIDEDDDSDDGTPISHDWTVEHRDEDSEKRGDIKHIVIEKLEIKDSTKQNQKHNTEPTKKIKIEKLLKKVKKHGRKKRKELGLRTKLTNACPR